MKIEIKIKRLENLIKEIAGMKRTKVPEYDCPLRHDHYKLSQILFGIGIIRWTCKFCGKEDSNE